MPATILYDQTCGFCLKSLRWVRERDRAGRFEALGCQNPERTLRFPAIAEAACLAEMCLVEPGGRVLRGLPGVWPLVGWLLAAPLVRVATRAGYRVIARNRHALGCDSGHCEI